MWSGTRLSWLCGGVFPGQADDIDFFGVGWPGRGALNLAAMRTPRSLPVMSAVDGWTLVVYQGAGPGDVPRRRGGDRRWRTSKRWWPGRRAGTGRSARRRWRSGCAPVRPRRPANLPERGADPRRGETADTAGPHVLAEYATSSGGHLLLRVAGRPERDLPVESLTKHHRTR